MELPRLSLHAIALPLLLDRGHVSIHAEIDAAIAHRLGQAVAEIAVEVAQDLVAAIKHGHGDA